MNINKRWVYIPVIATFLIAAILTSSCLKDIRELSNIKGVKIKDSFKPEFAIPLVHANLSIIDFVNQFKIDSLVRIDDDNLVSVIYKSNEYYGYARDFILITDQQFGVGPLSYSTGGSDSIRVSNNIYFDENIDNSVVFFEGEEMVKADLKSGKLVLNINSDFPRSGKLDIDIPGLTKSGVPFSKSIPLTYKWPSINIVDSIDLKDYHLDMTKQGTAFNTISIRYRITLNNNPSYIHTGDEVNVQTTFENVKYSYIEGFFGNKDIPYSADTLKLSIFDDSGVKRIYFADPKITVHCFNCTGLPVRMSPPFINSYSKEFGEKQLTGPAVASPIDINYPAISEVGQIKYTQLLAVKSNSNIVDVVNNMPRYMAYDFTLTTNPDGKTHSNFALDTSYVKVYYDVELPAYGRSEEWSLDLDTDIDKIEELDMLESIQFNILAKNEFPIDVSVQVYVLDSAENLLDSLMGSQQYMIGSAQIDANYKLINPNIQLTQIIFDNDRLLNLEDMRKLRVRVLLSTMNQGSENVKIFADSRIDIKMSMKTKLKVSYE
ncbi:hypothetical protein ACFLRI_02120 [Bacteroidota bacterium]